MSETTKRIDNIGRKLHNLRSTFWNIDHSKKCVGNCIQCGLDIYEDSQENANKRGKLVDMHINELATQLHQEVIRGKIEELKEQYMSCNGWMNTSFERRIKERIADLERQIGGDNE